jgi:hypothetical protein
MYKMVREEISIKEYLIGTLVTSVALAAFGAAVGSNHSLKVVIPGLVAGVLIYGICTSK